MLDEIDELIAMVLSLLEKSSVNVDTPGVTALSDKLTEFGVKYSCEGEVREVKHNHVPHKSCQKMNDKDVSSIIRFLLSQRRKQKMTLSSLWSLIHPEIVRVAESRMDSGHYADAVEGAFKELNNAVKAKTRQKLDRELDGQKLMQCVFSSEKPILLVEDDLESQTNNDTQQGYMMMFSGAMSAIRNPKAHENMEISKEDAIRKLMFASMLMYKLESSLLQNTSNP